jgi:hypothetical protein
MLAVETQRDRFGLLGIGLNQCFGLRIGVESEVQIGFVPEKGAWSSTCASGGASQQAES